MPIHVLHLTGSPTSDFFAELSLVYARGCIRALADDERYRFTLAYIAPDGRWRFPQSLETDAIATADSMSLSEALQRIGALKIDIALPQMFCMVGMTHYRALLELMRIPYLGNRPLQMALTADKAKARAVVAQAGVSIPNGQLLTSGDVPTLQPPVVVKPNTADNSDGISLVRTQHEYAAALERAYMHAPTVLIEEYIELGREVRCGIVVRKGKLVCLPLEEYYVDPTLRPIRTGEHKLTTDGGHELTLAAKQATQSWIVPTDDPITAEVWDAARRCHGALGCKQYSLFDFRIDPQGKAWFLEAGLYCSYSPQSVIPTMAAAADMPLSRLFADAIQEVLQH